MFPGGSVVFEKYQIPSPRVCVKAGRFLPISFKICIKMWSLLRCCCWNKNKMKENQKSIPLIKTHIFLRVREFRGHLFCCSSDIDVENLKPLLILKPLPLYPSAGFSFGRCLLHWKQNTLYFIRWEIVIFYSKFNRIEYFRFHSEAMAFSCILWDFYSHCFPCFTTSPLQARKHYKAVSWKLQNITNVLFVIFCLC